MPWYTGARAHANKKRHYYVVEKYLKAPISVRKLKLFDNSLKPKPMCRKRRVSWLDAAFFPINYRTTGYCPGFSLDSYHRFVASAATAEE